MKGFKGEGFSCSSRGKQCKAKLAHDLFLLSLPLSRHTPTPTHTQKNSSYWAVLLLRILAFVLPVYLIFQACLTFRRYRVARVSYGAASAAGGGGAAAAWRSGGGSEQRRGRSRRAAAGAAASAAAGAAASAAAGATLASVEPAAEAGATAAAPRRGDEAV